MSTRGLSAASVVAVVLGALLLAAPALAFHTYAPLTKVYPAVHYHSTSEDERFGSLLPNSIATDDRNGHLLVAESGAYGEPGGVIYDFSSPSSHNPTHWDGTNTPTGSFGGAQVTVAADNNPASPSYGDVYVADATDGLIYKFDQNDNLIKSFGDAQPAPDGQLSGRETPAGSFAPPGASEIALPIAVDATTGELFVADSGHKAIDVFSEAGQYLRQLDVTAPPAEAEGLFSTPLPGFRTNYSIAVNGAAGRVYLADWFPGRVFEFAASGAYLGSLDGSNTPDGDFGEGFGTFCAELGPYFKHCGVTLGVAVEEATGKLFITTGLHGGALDVFDSAGNYLPPPITNEAFIQGGLGPGWLEQPRGAITVDPATGDLYLDSDGVFLQLFEPVVAPDPTLESLEDLTALGATLRGTVDPATAEGGRPVTSCRFEYVDITEYTDTKFQNASSIPCSPDPATNPPSSAFTQPTAVTARPALSPGTEYRYRLTASNRSEGHGVAESSAPQAFTTPGSYQFSAHFGSPGSAAGQLSLQYGGSGDAGPAGSGLAVDDSTGDLYVADTANHRVDQFSSSGAFIRAWGWGVDAAEPKEELQTCTEETGCRAGIPGSAPGQFEDPAFVAVDNSSSPSAGDLYVGGGGSPLVNNQTPPAADRIVQKFTPSGQLISSWGEAGQFEFYVPGQGGPGSQADFNRLAGIAVDTHGDLFLDNVATGRWTELTPPGVLLRRFETGTEHTYQAGHGIAVDSRGGIYSETDDGATGVILYLPTSAQEVNPGNDGQRERIGEEKIDALGFEPFSQLITGLALDQSTSDLYVDHGELIRQFSPECTSHHGYERTCPPTDLIGVGHLDHAAGLAVDSSNHALYAANTGADDIAVFTPLPLPELTAEAPTEVTQATATLHGSLTSATPVEECSFEYGTTSSFGQSTPCLNPAGEPVGTPSHPIEGSAQPLHADLTGLLPFTPYHFRLFASAAADHGLPSYSADRTFVSTPAALPTVASSSPSTVTPTTATLAAAIDPQGSPTVYSFRYGATSALGSQTPVSEPIGEDTTDHPVSAEITGLTPATTYHYRVLALNFNGTTEGPELTFNTPAAPAVAESTASSTGPTTATLAALIKPGFRPTTYHFQYGTASTYGQSTPQSASIGEDDAAHSANAALTGLAPATTYHYRVLATNQIGTTPGPDQTFTTAPEAAKKVEPPTCSKHEITEHGKCACKHGYVKKRDHCVKKPKSEKHHKRGGKK